jgi:hypothetical protein
MLSPFSRPCIWPFLSIFILNNEEGLPPCPRYPHQKHEEEPISFRRVWPFDVSPKKHQLLAQEGILGHQYSFSPSEIHERFELQ